MKTPKEEAESLALKTSTGLFSKDRLNSSQVVKVTDASLDTIPLAELIAVARAAKKVVQNVEGELLIDTYFSKEGAELLAALQALRATGKVTL